VACSRPVTAFAVRTVVAAITMGVATALVDGVDVAAASPSLQAVTLLAVAVLFGMLNAVVRPVLRLLALPLYLLTLGLITFVVNAVVLLLTSWAAGRLGLPFVVDGLVPALIAAVVISLVSFAFNVVLPERYER